MPTEIEFFGSLSSPYCYFALDRLDGLALEQRARIIMRPVLPGVLRMPEYWSSASQSEMDYLELDISRTAQFLGLPYGHPNPSPVEWVERGVWQPGPDQGLTYRLYNMLFRAYERSKAYDLCSSLMRLIWSGKTPGWNERDHLGPCLESCRLPASLVEQPDVLTSSAENYFASNQQALFDCGHWGVPTMSCVDGSRVARTF